MFLFFLSERWRFMSVFKYFATRTNHPDLSNIKDNKRDNHQGHTYDLRLTRLLHICVHISEKQ